MAKAMSLTAALKDFFGYKPGQTLAEFMNEVRSLSDRDKEYFKRELATVGYTVS